MKRLTLALVVCFAVGACNRDEAPKPSTLSSSAPEQERPVRVLTTRVAGADQVVARIKAEGIPARVYKPERAPQPAESKQGIWVGVEVRPEHAVKVIRIARRIWPHLRYVNLDGEQKDVPKQVRRIVFLGGSTASAKEAGLVRWSDADFAELRPAMSLAELHAKVRKLRRKWPIDSKGRKR